MKTNPLWEARANGMVSAMVVFRRTRLILGRGDDRGFMNGMNSVGASSGVARVLGGMQRNGRRGGQRLRGGPDGRGGSDVSPLQ